MTNLDCVEEQRHYSANKGLSGQGHGPPSGGPPSGGPPSGHVWT